MYDIVRATVLLAFLIGIPAVTIGLILFGVLSTRRVVLATASTTLGLTILIGERIVREGVDASLAALGALLLVSLTPTVVFWAMFRRGRSRDDREGEASGPEDGEIVEI